MKYRDDYLYFMNNLNKSTSTPPIKTSLKRKSDSSPSSVVSPASPSSFNPTSRLTPLYARRCQKPLLMASPLLSTNEVPLLLPPAPQPSNAHIFTFELPKKEESFILAKNTNDSSTNKVTEITENLKALSLEAKRRKI